MLTHRICVARRPNPLSGSKNLSGSTSTMIADQSHLRKLFRHTSKRNQPGGGRSRYSIPFIGIRHMVQKPIIHMHERGEKIPFDVSLLPLNRLQPNTSERFG